MEENGHFARGLLFGAIAGAAASLAMNQFQQTLSRRMVGYSHPHGAQSLRTGGPTGENHHAGPGPDQDDPATKAAAAVTDTVAGVRPRGEAKRRSGALAHYAFGMSVAAIYGMAAQKQPAVTMLAGAPFGLAVWLLADQIAVPALGLSKHPRAYPREIDQYSIASHLVYGCVTEGVRRLLDSQFEPARA